MFTYASKRTKFLKKRVFSLSFSSKAVVQSGLSTVAQVQPTPPRLQLESGRLEYGPYALLNPVWAGNFSKVFGHKPHDAKVRL